MTTHKHNPALFKLVKGLLNDKRITLIRRGYYRGKLRTHYATTYQDCGRNIWYTDFLSLEEVIYCYQLTPDWETYCPYR